MCFDFIKNQAHEMQLYRKSFVCYARIPPEPILQEAGGNTLEENALLLKEGQILSKNINLFKWLIGIKG